MIFFASSFGMLSLNHDFSPSRISAPLHKMTGPSIESVWTHRRAVSKIRPVAIVTYTPACCARSMASLSRGETGSPKSAISVPSISSVNNFISCIRL